MISKKNDKKLYDKTHEYKIKKNDEHFIAIYKDKNNRWKKSEREKVEDIMDPLADKDGLVIMLFYSAIIQIGQ